MSDGRPMLIQRSKNPKKGDANNLCRCEDLRVCVELAASFGKQAPVKPQGKVERINHSFADHKSHPIVDDHPIGYPQLAAFIKSDNNFLIARKYGVLRARVLLYHQRISLPWIVMIIFIGHSHSIPDDTMSKMLMIPSTLVRC